MTSPIPPPATCPDKGLHWTWTTFSILAIHLGALLIFVVRPDAIGIAMCVGLFVIRGFCITAGYHRYFAHHAFRTNRPFQFLLAFIGGTCAQKGVLWWVAHHRHHHMHSDTELDIHSAQRDGFYWSHFGWMISKEYLEAYNPHIVRDWTRYPELVWLDKNHLVPPALLALLCYLLHGWVGLIWGFFLSTVLVNHITFSINSVCHMFGSRRFETGESSRNTWWLCLASLGESWHNNHHKFPGSSRNGLYWWEIDVTYLALKVLAAIGIVKGLKVPVISPTENTQASPSVGAQ